jgi:transcriptional regulator with PAS, ATPase and Fis domain
MTKGFPGRASPPDRVMNHLLLNNSADQGQDGLIGPSASLQRLREKISRVAAAPRTTVLITGESGVGKEVVARAIHQRSDRRDGPFVALNCAALSEGLLESELFGHEAGAYTGASNKGREGLFAAAKGGTLLLDEIGELAPQLQAKLLRVLQERSYRKVGGNVDYQSDVRVIACTNRDLPEMVEEGTFREDLYYRLNVLVLRVPTLRDRPEDILPIATHLRLMKEEESSFNTQGFSAQAEAALMSHSWPGNVRELGNAIERACIECTGTLIEPEHLGLSTPADSTEDVESDEMDLNIKNMEERLIRQALHATGGNRSRSALLLGVNRATLYNKLRVYEIA